MSTEVESMITENSTVQNQIRRPDFTNDENLHELGRIITSYAVINVGLNQKTANLIANHFLTMLAK